MQNTGSAKIYNLDLMELQVISYKSGNGLLLDIHLQKHK